MTDSFDATMSIGVIGACWYLKPDRFLTLSNRFLTQSIGSGHLERRYVSMKKSSLKQDGNVGDAMDWLISEGHFLDISAYALACAALPSNLSLYLIFNDTLFTRHPWRLISRRFGGLRENLATIPMPAAAAEIHPSTGLVLVDAHNATRRHLSTFCLLLNNSAFQLFSRLLSDLPTSGDSDIVLAWIEDRVTAYPALRALLHVHLFGARTPWSWRQNDAKLFRRKAVTVVFEYIFTVELLACGVGMPVNHDILYRLRAKLGRHG